MSNQGELPLSELWIEKLKQTPQNPRYHAERSVYHHTKMVVDKYHEMHSEFDLSEEEKEILYWVAVLHDTGKAIVTKMLDGRWVSHGHEEASVPIARDYLLKNTTVNEHQFRNILSLIRWHGRPLRWILKQGSIEDLKELGTRVNLRLLGIFAIFDFYGRISENQEFVTSKMRELQSLHIPRAEYELGRFSNLQTEFSEWDIQKKNAAWLAISNKKIDLLQKLVNNGDRGNKSLPYKVNLTIGPPMSGKTRFLDNAMKEVYRIQLSDFGLTDELAGNTFQLNRRLVEFKHLLAIYLRNHRQVAIEGRNIAPELRKGLNKVFRDLSAEIHYYFFESPKKDLIERNKQLEDKVDEDVIEELYKKQLDPHPWEAHRIHYIRS